MTTTPQHPAISADSPSRRVAGEIRAEMGRQGIRQSTLARMMHVGQPWLSRRIGLGADVDITFEEALDMAQALRMDPQRLVTALLPRLDSNQQPSGYVSAQVVDLASFRATGRVTPYPRPLEDDEERAS